MPAAVVVVVVVLSYLLHRLTLRALHLRDFESVHLVVLLCIVAQPTHVQFTTARCLKCIKKTTNRNRI